MSKIDELPQWFMDMFLEFISDVRSNKDKFQSTGTAKVTSGGNPNGYALHNPETQELIFVGIKRLQKDDELEYCHIKTEFPTDE